MTVEKTHYIVDTTLRDGEQTAGVVFSQDEKVAIAKMLSEASVDQIEIGIPAMGGDEFDTVKAICALGLSTSLLTWNRADVEDIKCSLECNVDAVCISISSSDIHIHKKLGVERSWVLEQIRSVVGFAKSNNLYVVLSAEDASRADYSFLMEFCETGRAAGADRIRICDTIGLLWPRKTSELIGRICADVALPIEVHMHNDFGMATANTIVALDAGASFANVTVNGLGERAGNASLEEVVMALAFTQNKPTHVNLSKLAGLSKKVAAYSGKPIADSKPILGGNIFIRQANQSEPSTSGHSSDAYEAFSPDIVGATRQILIGKHSGAHDLQAKYDEFGIKLDDEKARELLVAVRKFSIDKKRALFEKELMELYLKL